MTSSRTVNPSLDLDQIFRSTLNDREAAEAGRLSATDVMDRVTEILGYDIFEAELLAEGYRELGPEMLEWSETALSANTEPLPPE